MNISNLVNALTNNLNKMETPAKILPASLIKMIAINRPGLSAYKITSEIIQKNTLINIPTGKNPNGSENIINQYTYNIVKSVVDAIKNDAVVQVAIPMESLTIQATGANAGGPLTAVGTNLTDSIGNGIMR